MPLLQQHHIVDIYTWVDDNMPEIPTGPGRPSILTRSELVTILIWGTLVLKHKHQKEVWQSMHLYHKHDFKKLPSYSAFNAECLKSTTLLHTLLTSFLASNAWLRIVDATMLPVVKNHRADRYMVAKDIVKWGKNWQGWFLGFKLHISCTHAGVLCGISITSANAYDAQALPYILNEHAKLVVGDTLYGASVMKRIVYEKFGTIIIAPVFPKQKKKVMGRMQEKLLHSRSKIETVFDYLKNHLNLVTSFPRSPLGYLFHYFRVLLAYQVGRLLSI